VVQGQSLGWFEGFKAVTELFSIASGTFAGVNAALATDLSIVDRDPYDRGWLYEVRGDPAGEILDVHQYVAYLDSSIDRLLAHQGERGDEPCPAPGH
jgi:glycine cleavage system H protein